MYAVIRTGGKQYRVAPGQQLRVERLPGSEGDTVELTDILMVGGDDAVTVGAPRVDNARVIAEIVAQGRDRKIQVFKYKSKKRYRRLRGHRQLHTMLAIKQIVGPGSTTPQKTKRRTATRRTAAKEAPESAPEAGATEAPEED